MTLLGSEHLHTLGRFLFGSLLYGVYVFIIPRNALVPENIPDAKERVGDYGISTVFFMGSSSFMYAATLFVNILKNACLSPLWAWRAVLHYLW